MKRVTKPVLLVGSIPLASTEEILTACGNTVGGLVPCLPDGETGHRRMWIIFVAAGVYAKHPDVVSLRTPKPYDKSNPAEWRQPGEDWIPLGYEDHYLFALKPGVKSIRFPTLGYADEAKNSYAIFRSLRQKGVFAADVRFQVCLPLPESAVRPFVTSEHDYRIFHAAYVEAMRRELDALTEIVPPADLAIQWDITHEVLAAAVGEASSGLFPWTFASDPVDRYAADLRALNNIHADAWLGLHLCYGDLGHKHFVEPTDLANVVNMANVGVKSCGRAIDFVHFPVPRDRSDDPYFAPLKDLAIADAKLYLGLVHRTGGLDAAKKRIAGARRHVGDFGVATECGFGRRPAAHVRPLLELHAAVAREL